MNGTNLYYPFRIDEKFIDILPSSTYDFKRFELRCLVFAPIAFFNQICTLNCFHIALFFYIYQIVSLIDLNTNVQEISWSIRKNLNEERGVCIFSIERHHFVPVKGFKCRIKKCLPLSN